MEKRSGRWELVITVNSPGEVSGWLAPVLDRIARARAGEKLDGRPVTSDERRDCAHACVGEEWDCRITVFVPPCPFASGAECRVIRAIPGVDLVAGPAETFAYLLLGKKPQGFALYQRAQCFFRGSLCRPG